MKSVIAAIAAVGISAAGGAFAVYGSYDDSPGGTLLGILIVAGAMAVAGRTAWRSRPSSSTTRAP